MTHFVVEIQELPRCLDVICKQNIDDFIEAY